MDSFAHRTESDRQSFKLLFHIALNLIYVFQPFKKKKKIDHIIINNPLQNSHVIQGFISIKTNNNNNNNIRQNILYPKVGNSVTID